MCDSAKMEVYLNPVKYCKTPTGHPKGHPCCKIADYDDTALGTGTLTVHPWRAGPDCGKLLYSMYSYTFYGFPTFQCNPTALYCLHSPIDTKMSFRLFNKECLLPNHFWVSTVPGTVPNESYHF